MKDGNGHAAGHDRRRTRYTYSYTVSLCRSYSSSQIGLGREAPRHVWKVDHLLDRCVEIKCSGSSKVHPLSQLGRTAPTNLDNEKALAIWCQLSNLDTDTLPLHLLLCRTKSIVISRSRWLAAWPRLHNSPLVVGSRRGVDRRSPVCVGIGHFLTAAPAHRVSNDFHVGVDVHA